MSQTQKKLVRKDSPNKTTQELLDEGWVFLESNKYEYIIRAMMNMIRSELDREYWNRNQKEMVSPFDNTGASDFVTDYLTIRSYNWDDNELPNFDTDTLKVFWYKHSNRGVLAMAKNTHDIDHILINALNNSIASINATFKKKEK